jgi:hypothetical protein
MRKTSVVTLLVLLLSVGALVLAGQNSAGSKLAGGWAGTWSGGSAGKFEMTITSAADGKLSATLIATPETGDGSTFQSKSVDTVDNKVKIKLEDSEGNAEVLLEGTLEGSSLKGTYSVRDKAQGAEVETGNWTATKK